MIMSNFAESWKDLYKNYIGTINFVAGDYETLKSAIRQNIVNSIPENYTDFSDSSEVAMFSNSIAYLGENLHYRIDFSVHDLFPQTTERKKALLDFVKMLSYFPQRNICALGLGKIVSVRTDEDIEDSMGTSLAGQTIGWNDTSNDNWQEQFLTVMNAAFSSNNTFGNPKKTENINGVVTQIYQMNTEVNNACVYTFVSNINNESVSFDVVNPDLDLDNASIYERTPVPESSFQMIYRNDGAGNSSINTGFFVMWKQGTLTNAPYEILEKEQNRRIDINQPNINATDVWVTEEDTTTGLTKSVWTQIDNTEYLAYNTRDVNNKNLYKVETRDNDEITLVFGDGNFSNIPYGTYNFWYRSSSSNNLYIKADDIQNIAISIPYRSQNTSDTTTYHLLIVFSVADFSHIRQSSATESIEATRQAAPLVYSTQDRMVSNTDYNRYPLIAGDRIRVLKSLLRTYAGNSRYINFVDPTGTYTGMNVIGKDGYLYGHVLTNNVVTTITSEDEATKFINNIIIPTLSKMEMSSLYYDMYDGVMIPASGDDPYVWEPMSISGGTILSGRFRYGAGSMETLDNVVSFDSIKQQFNVGDSICFENDKNEILWLTIQSITEGTTEKNYTIEVSPMPDISQVWHLRHSDDNKSWSKMNCFNTSIASIQNQLIMNLQQPPNTFGITFDSYNRTWIFSNPDELSDEIKMIYVPEDNAHARPRVLNWFFRFTYNNPSQSWTVESREKYYAFGSEGETSFYFNSDNLDENGYFSTSDYIKIMNMNKEYTWKPYDTFIYSDGYVNPAKFKAKAFDYANSMNVINPLQFKEIISEKEDTLIFEKDTEYQVGNQIQFTNKNNPSAYLENDFKGSMWESTTKSGYYYCKYKCNAIYPAGTDLPKPVYQPKTKNKYIALSDGSIKYFEGGIWRAGDHFDYDIVDYISHYEGFDQDAKPVFYGDEGYLYYYNAKTHELTELDKSNYVIEQGATGLVFLWVHYPNEKQVIDPCTTNIVDMFVLTSTYYNEVMNWLSNGKIGEFPTAPTSTELSSIFAGIEEKKSISDTIIWHPVVYKKIFGYGSSTKNKCIFKVIKINDLVSDNEIKQLVVRLIDEYFQTLSVGETFYFSKLDSYIHVHSNGMINSVYPSSADNNDDYGTLLEIGCEDNELLLSTATVDNVQIISTIK